MKKKLDKVTRAMVRRAVLYLLDKYNIPYEVPVTAQNAVQIASQLYAEGILTADMLVEINLSSEMLSELILSSSLDSSPNLILNTVTGATAAYSLRQINANYTGPLIRVRRSDNQELDITGNPAGINETQLTTFVGSSSAFVTIIYDQSGNNYNLAQTVAANQPQIVINGAINRVNGKPAILFDGVNDTFRTLFSIGNTMTRFMVMSHLSPQNNDDIVLDDGISADAAYLLFPSATTLRIYNPGGTVNYSGVANNVQFATYNLFNGTSGQISVNNIAPVSGSIGNITYNGVTVGSRGGATPGYHANFHFQELIMYNSNQSANRQTVMNNINQHYQIYWDGSQQRLLDQYPNAAAAYSLRNLSTTYTGPLVRVRRASDNLELNVYGRYDGTLDTQSLTSFCSATNGFVTTWYDQSGLVRNATQTTAANQPQIVSSGSLILQNEKPSVQFDGSNDFLNRSESASNLFAVNFSVFFVHNVTGGSTRKFLIETTSVGSNVYNPSLEYNGALPTNIRLFSGELSSAPFTISTNTFSGNIQRLVSALKNGTTIQEIFVNNASQGSTSPSVTPTINITGYNIGTFRSANDRFFGGNMQEIILYNSYESSNRTGIESNINSFYQIY